MAAKKAAPKKTAKRPVSAPAPTRTLPTRKRVLVLSGTGKRHFTWQQGL